MRPMRARVLSRRVLVLLSIPGFPFALMLTDAGATSGVYGTASGGYLIALYLVPVLIAGLVVISMLRVRRRPAPDGAS